MLGTRCVNLSKLAVYGLQRTASLLNITTLRLLFTDHRLLITVYGLLFTAFFLFISPSASYSQSQAAPYWQYEASGPLQHVVPADLDEDGIDDFVLVDELGRVTLVNAKGEREWRQEVGAPVTAVGILPQPISNTTGQAVVLGLEMNWLCSQTTGMKYGAFR